MLPVMAVAKIVAPLAVHQVATRYRKNRRNSDLSNLGKRDHMRRSMADMALDYATNPATLASAIPLVHTSVGKALRHPYVFNTAWHKAAWPAIHWLDAIRIAHHAAKPRHGYR